MRILVTASAHFAITDDGALWTPTASTGYTFSARYLDVFDEASLLVRAHPRRGAGRVEVSHRPGSQGGSLARFRRPLGVREQLRADHEDDRRRALGCGSRLYRTDARRESHGPGGHAERIR